MKEKAEWMLSINEVYLLNGIIRKFKPKNCLEIGVSRGGSSVLILNAIKDIKDSLLISLDLNEKLFINKTLETGYIVKEYFPELAKNWKLFKGDQPHKFLDKLNIKFDFLFLDTSHYTPGEIINIIEALPFLKDYAIVVLHDIIWHFWATNDFKEAKFTPTQIYLLSSLYGEKIYIKKEMDQFENIGAAILYPNQEKHYINYFLLLLSFWEEIPTENQINDLKIFIKKYYKNEKYLNIFNSAVEKNKIYNKRFKEVLNKCLNSK